DAPVALRARPFDQAHADETVEHLRDGGGCEVGGGREPARRERALAPQPEEGLGLRGAGLAVQGGLAAAEAPDRGHCSLEGSAELRDRLLARRLLALDLRRAHAASTAGTSSVGASAPCSARAARSARTSTMHGMIASAVMPSDHQNAVP